MADPFVVFNADDEFRRETLKAVWPELYNVLARVDESAAKRWGCAMPTHDRGPNHSREYVPVAGRLTLNGIPACAPCLAAVADRPDGYPLERINPREWNR